MVEDGDQLDLSFEKCRSITKSQGGRKHPTNNKERRKANWTGPMFRRNCLLKHVVEGREDEEENI